MLAKLRLVDERDAGRDQQQRRRQTKPGQAAVAARVAPVRRDRDHDRQRADHHRRQRPAGALDRRREQQVIEEVADRGELQRFPPIGARQLAKARAVEPRQRQCDETERGVAPDGQQRRRIVRQQQRRDEHQSPHQAGDQREQHTHDHRATPPSFDGNVPASRRARARRVELPRRRA